MIERNVPLLSIDEGDEDWFAFQSVATGKLLIDASFQGARSDARFELRNSSGELIPFKTESFDNAEENTFDVRLTATASAGETYLLGVSDSSSRVKYALNIKAFTADLGVVVHRDFTTAIKSGEEIYYLIETVPMVRFQRLFRKVVMAPPVLF